MRIEPTTSATTQRANRPPISRFGLRPAAELLSGHSHKFVNALFGVGNLTGQLPDGRLFSVEETSFSPAEQVKQTIPKLRRYIQEDARTFKNSGFVGQLKQKYPYASTQEIAFREAKRRLRFATDQDISRSVFGAEGLSGSPDWIPIEILQRPVDVVAQSGSGPVDGDCDDFTMMVCSVSLALDPDADVQMVCVPADQDQPGVLSHIYASVDGTPVDASHGDYVGWQVPDQALTGPRQYFPVEEIGIVELVAMAYFALNGYHLMKQMGWIN